MNEGLKALQDLREHYFFERDEEETLNIIEKELKSIDLIKANNITELQEYLLNLLLLGKLVKDDINIRKLSILTYDESTRIYGDITIKLKQLLIKDLKRY